MNEKVNTNALHAFGDVIGKALNEAFDCEMGFVFLVEPINAHPAMPCGVLSNMNFQQTLAAMDKASKAITTTENLAKQKEQGTA